MPDYDEYGISYKDRTMYNHLKAAEETLEVRADYFHAVVVDGYFGGTWDRSMIKGQLNVSIHPLKWLNKRQLAEIEKSRKKYHRFFE